MTSGLRLALSFVATAAGWAAGLAWFVARAVHGPGFGYVTDFEAVAGWSGLFCGLTWALAVGPLATRGDHGGAVYRFPLAPVFGAAAGLAAFLVLVGSWTSLARAPAFLVHAALVGAATWTAYLGLARSRLAGLPAGRQARIAWVAPLLVPAAVLGVLFVAWPALERVAPGVAYRYGAPASRSRILARAIRSLRVGDSLAPLQALDPAWLRYPTGRVTGNLGGRFQYRIEMDQGRVIRIEASGDP